MNERLMELIHDAICMYEDLQEECRKEDAFILTDDFEFITNHLLKNGVYALPCKIGDTVYMVILNRVLELEVTLISLRAYDSVAFTGRNVSNITWSFNGDDIGKTVFLTREEAEAAQAERTKKWMNLNL